MRKDKNDEGPGRFSIWWIFAGLFVLVMLCWVGGKKWEGALQPSGLGLEVVSD